MTELNPAHPLVQEALPGFSGHRFDFDVPDRGFDGQPYEEDYDDIDEYEDEDDNRGNLIAPGEPRMSRA
jgi:hypothetical protein